MAGKKITARTARQIRTARKARHNARKAREALEAKEALKESESTQNCIVIPLKNTITYRPPSFDELVRNNRRREARGFLSLRKYLGVYPCGDVKKTLIGTRRPYSWTEVDKSTGVTWVAIYGMDFMTIVYKKVENAAFRAGYGDPESFNRGFSSFVIDEMEDIVDGIIRPENKLPPGVPFALVCETTSTTNVQEATNVAPDPPAFAEFIRNEYRRDFSLYKSSKYIKLAISVLQLVHEQKFKADDIWVSLWRSHTGHGSLSHDSINKYLTVINRPDSGGCDEKHLVVNEPDSGACSKEENSHDISGGFIEKHLDVNEPDSGGCRMEEVGAFT